VSAIDAAYRRELKFTWNYYRRGRWWSQDGHWLCADLDGAYERLNRRRPFWLVATSRKTPNSNGLRRIYNSARIVHEKGPDGVPFGANAWLLAAYDAGCRYVHLEVEV